MSNEDFVMGLYSVQCKKRLPCVRLSLHVWTAEPVSEFGWDLMWVCWVNFILIHYHSPNLYRAHKFIIFFYSINCTSNNKKGVQNKTVISETLLFGVHVFVQWALCRNSEQKDCYDHAWFNSESLLPLFYLHIWTFKFHKKWVSSVAKQN